MVALAELGLWLDAVILKVFSNLRDSDSVATGVTESSTGRWPISNVFLRSGTVPSRLGGASLFSP